AHSGSDHFPFMQYGYNIVYGSEGDFSPHWHRATDVIDNMDIPYMSEVVKMGLATLATVAGPPESFPDPLIAFESYVMDDDDQGGSTGNGNGHFDPGETVQISLSLHNYGDAQAGDVTGRLLTNDPYVTILDDTQSFGDIAPGGTGTSQAQFRFVISEDCPNGRYLNFSVDADAAGGLQWTTYFTVRIEQPTILYNTFSFEETVGDGDGILDPGETVNLSILIRNGGLRGGSGITAELETEDPDITITDGEAVFPDIAVDAVGANSGDPFTFSVSEGVPLHPVLFTVRLSEGEGYYRTDFAFRLLMGQGRVLVVADDGGADNAKYYIQALKYMGVMYDLFEIEGRDKVLADSLSDYGEVIWFTGATGVETLTDEDRVALADYLDGGGHLLLSGSLIGFDVGTTPFFRDHLHAQYVHFFTHLHHLRGVGTNPIVGDMNIDLAVEGENLQTFTGETDPLPPAFSLFNYDRGTEEGPGDIRSSGSGALAFENERYKLVYFSFGLEGVEPFKARVALLGSILAWFNAPAVLRGDVNADGRIDVLDVVLAVRIGLGTYEPTSEQFERADINYDGSVDLLDVMGIVHRIVHGSGQSSPKF
ncbi:MAG: dockerin type I domain-containing protein, partial [bacterium]